MTTSARRSYTVAFLLRLVWIATLLGTLYQVIDTWASLYTATGAPQQAAGAAMGACYIVGFYVIARAIEQMTAPLPTVPSAATRPEAPRLV